MKNKMPCHSPRSLPFKGTKLAMAFALVLPALAAHTALAQSAPTPDPSAAQQPGIAAVNGTPIVNIVAPNGAGVSHNRFTDYQVGPNGLILNNSSTAVQTQLGGRIDGNTQLGGTSASVILNEVTGAGVSRLQGATEIAGPAARLIVANPNGIGTDGASFINATRVTLAAGNPVFDKDGGIASFDTRGRVAIDGAGLDAGNVAQLDLVGQSIRVNADLRARTLAAVAIDGNVAFDGDRVTYREKAGSAPSDGDVPDVLLDVSRLGSMHANAITLVGKSRGVGVNVAGKVDVVAGDLEVSKTRGIVINGKEVTGAPDDAARRSARMAGNGGLAVAGNLRNGGTVHAERVSIQNDVEVADGASLQSDKDLAIEGSAINAGRLRGREAVSIRGSLTNRQGGRIDSGGAISIGGAADNAGELRSAASTTIGGNLLNRQRAEIDSGGAISIGGAADNAGELRSAASTTIGGILLNRHRAAIDSGGAISLGGAADNAGELRSAASTTIGGNLVNRQRAEIDSGGAIDIGGAADNAGQLRGNASIRIGGGLINRQDGRIDSGGVLGIGGGADNAGELWGEKAVKVGGNLKNLQGARVGSAGAVTVDGAVSGPGEIEQFVKPDPVPPVEPPVVEPPVEPPVVEPPVKPPVVEPPVKPPVVEPPVVVPPVVTPPTPPVVVPPVKVPVPTIVLPAWMKPYVSERNLPYVTFE
ncbi:filamentous hemagglutinin N-terminal domain-containing protein [Burkholderia alba]|uniref:filamentous hemagglutinin N-terminal domain-containing protein n=1 Tax=Burkholderia alba TaxID=2683677 RepID=UPI002B05A9B1|nr:filamentous hemagglutinin N-terminal domain-containing protein [Burkholderia alba]